MGAVLDPVFDVISGGKDSEATAATQASVDALQALQLPDIADMQVQLEELVQTGQLTPEQAEAMLIERSNMEDISTDPRLRNAQLDALGGLQDIVDGEGMTATDRARLEQLKGDLNTQERGQRESIIQNAQQRGVGGSGLELLAQLQNQQGSAQRASQMGFDIEAQAQERALEALMQQGQLGGQIRGQDFGEQEKIAAAQDAIAKFNTQNQQQAEFTNVAARNDAQAANLAERQRVSDANVATRNEQQAHNKNLLQQDFENQYKRAGGVSNAYSNQAAALGQQGAARQQLVGGAASAAIMASDEREKENIQDFDSSKFLDSITGHKYSYKKPEKFGEGEQVGVMAQDVEKVAPQAVLESPEGTKMIDYDKLGGPILASLADIDKRLKKEGK